MVPSAALVNCAERTEQKLIDGAAIMRGLSAERHTASVLVRIRSERESLIKELIAVLEAPHRAKADRAESARILGLLRAPEAVGPLMRNLSMTPGLFARAVGYSKTFPCALALVQIGKPASEAAVAALPGEPDDVNRSILAWVIAKIEGEHEGRRMLSRKLQTLKGQKRRRVDAAVKAVAGWAENWEGYSRMLR